VVGDDDPRFGFLGGRIEPGDARAPRDLRRADQPWDHVEPLAVGCRHYRTELAEFAVAEEPARRAGLAGDGPLAAEAQVVEGRRALRPPALEALEYLLSLAGGNVAEQERVVGGAGQCLGVGAPGQSLRALGAGKQLGLLRAGGEKRDPGAALLLAGLAPLDARGQFARRAPSQFVDPAGDGRFPYSGDLAGFDVGDQDLPGAPGGNRWRGRGLGFGGLLGFGGRLRRRGGLLAAVEHPSQPLAVGAEACPAGLAGICAALPEGLLLGDLERGRRVGLGGGLSGASGSGGRQRGGQHECRRHYATP
jgi:hypothetical protein